MLERGKRLNRRYMVYNIFEQFKTDVYDVSKFFYIIDGGMILHRLKRQTAKIKIDLLMFFAKN
jgi:hypothetical protein